MDDINKKILSDLKKDSRTPFLKIAKELNVTEGTIRQRVAKLKDEGTIKKFTIDTKDNSKAVIGIYTNPETKNQEIIDELKKLDLMKIYEVAGDFDLICILKDEDQGKIKEKIEKMKIIKGMGDIKLFPVFKEI